MRIAIAAACLSVLIPTATFAAIQKSGGSNTVSPKQTVQLADYYKGGKVCRRVGSATVCN